MNVCKSTCRLTCDSCMSGSSSEPAHSQYHATRDHVLKSILTDRYIQTIFDFRFPSQPGS